MFVFASDNTLSPVIVSQLKAIKEAGFYENTEVLVYFDPSEKGVPTKIYNVNRERKRRRQERRGKKPKLSKNIIGDGEDPFVHNLEEDDITLDESFKWSESAASKMLAALKNPDDISAKEALTLFLDFCRENHQAEHYILFLIGHGMIVANDAFLPDENPVSSITLKELREILEDFNGKVKEDKNTFELLALHSCSMSAIEVAYELKATAKKETAKLMMASEGISYVNSWPHRQLLKKLFKTIDREETGKQDVDVNLLMRKLFLLSFFNAKDFNLSGYPLDLALCNLENEDNFDDLTKGIKELVKRLKESVSDEGRGKELILLAHLEAQSYWGETYTDLFDFCRCLHARCGGNRELEKLRTACNGVIERLKPRKLEEKELESFERKWIEKLEPIESAEEREKLKREKSEALEKLERDRRFEGLVIFSRSFGSAYQYSHGLSVYFPWAEPVENVGNGNRDKLRKDKKNRIKNLAETTEDEKIKELLLGYLNRIKGILERYQEYAFTTELKGVPTTESEDNSWLSFLKTYFEKTRRKKTRRQEDGLDKDEPKAETARVSRNLPGGVPGNAPVGGGQPGVIPSSISLDPPKDSPSSGVACICTTIKNYPPIPPRERERASEEPKDLSEEYSDS